MQAGKIYLQNNGNTFYLGGTIVYRSSNWAISVVLLFHFKDGKFPYLCLVVHFDKLFIIVHLFFVMKNDRGCYLFVNFCCCCCYLLIICIYFSNFSFFPHILTSISCINLLNFPSYLLWKTANFLNLSWRLQNIHSQQVADSPSSNSSWFV